jgi:hypothetical protein
MRRVLGLLALALIAATGCSGGEHLQDSSRGRLEVNERILGHLYIEGSVASLRVTRGSASVYAGRLGNGKAFSLSPGTYRLDSYQELCIGNCGHLGLPIDRCGTTIHVASARTTTATVELTPTQNRCRIVAH